MRRIFLLLGIAGGLYWLALPFFPPACVPVTELTENFCNRLWTPALAGMFIGAFGLFGIMDPYFTRALKIGLHGIRTGNGLMIVGNFAEYWVFYGLPHEGPDGWLRGLLWMGVLLGWLFVLLGSLVSGISLVRSPVEMKRLGMPFVLIFPLTFVFGLISPAWAGIPLGLSGIWMGLSGLRLERHHLARGH